MDKFFSDVQKKGQKPTAEPVEGEQAGTQKKAIPKGVVLGPDGKPYVQLQFNLQRKYTLKNIC